MVDWILVLITKAKVTLKRNKEKMRESSAASSAASFFLFINPTLSLQANMKRRRDLYILFCLLSFVSLSTLQS